MSERIIKFFVFSLFFIIIIFPILNLFASIFSIQYESSAISSFVNYMSFFYDPRLITIFARTLIFAFGTAILCLCIGVPIAFLFEKTNIPGKSFLRIISYLPLLIPPYISTIAWMEFLGARGDLINISLPFSIYNLHTAIIIMSLSMFPIVTLLTSLAIRNLDSKLEEAASLITTKKNILRKITLPLIKPQILIAGFFVFILTLSEYGVPSMLRINTYSNEIFAQFSAFFNLESAVILSLPLVFAAILLITFYNFWLKDKSFVTISTNSNRKNNLFELSKLQKIISMVFVVSIITLAFFIPLSVLLIESNLKFLEALILAHNQIFNSLWLALLGAGLMTISGFFVAYFSKNSKYLDLFILLPIAIPSSIIGISLIYFWNNPAANLIYTTFLIIILGYFIQFLPFVVKTFSPFLSQISPSVGESAKLTKAGFFKRISEIEFPLAKQGVLAGFVVGFVLCLRELGATLLISPPGIQTLPCRIETLMHYGNAEMVSSLSIILILMILIPVVVLLLTKKELVSKI